MPNGDIPGVSYIIKKDKVQLIIGVVYEKEIQFNKGTIRCFIYL